MALGIFVPLIFFLDYLLKHFVGWQTTISATTGTWLAIPYYGNLIAILLGGIGGHLIAMVLFAVAGESSIPATRKIAFASSAVILYVYTAYFT